jgi:hypothetical protein
MKTEPLLTRENIENGLCAEVHKICSGKYAGMYSVCLRDTDANETLPTIEIFDYLGDARQYADKIIN